MYAHISIRTFSRVSSKRGKDGSVIDTDLCPTYQCSSPCIRLVTHTQEIHTKLKQNKHTRVDRIKEIQMCSWYRIRWVVIVCWECRKCVVLCVSIVYINAGQTRLYRLFMDIDSHTWETSRPAEHIFTLLHEHVRPFNLPIFTTSLEDDLKWKFVTNWERNI